MWNKLRARHYSVLILLAIVTLETSAIGIDRLMSRRQDDVAFHLDGEFQNNCFVQQFLAPEPETMTAAPRQAASSSKTTTTVEANFVAAARETPRQEGFVEYSVRKGDSLVGIASLFGLQTESLAQVNQLSDKHAIRAGQTLRVPLAQPSLTYTVQDGDSLSKVAGRFGVSLAEIVQANKLKSFRLTARQKLDIPVRARRQDLKTVSLEKPAVETRSGNLTLIRTSAISNGTALAKVSTTPSLSLISAPKLPQPTLAAVAPEVKAAETLPVSISVALTPAPVEILPTVVPTAGNLSRAEVEAPTTLAAKPAQSEPILLSGADKDTYIISRGDSLSSIAKRFNTTVAALMQINELAGGRIHAGQSLRVRPNEQVFRVVSKNVKKPVESEVAMISHTVKNGDCLSLLARRHNTTVAQIVSTNQLKQTLLTVGQTITIPANQRLYKVSQVSSRKSSQSWTWPMSRKFKIGDRYGWRKHPVYRRQLFHAGVDIPAPRGTPIYSARAGQVVYSGWRRGYGRLVIVRHSNGYTTRYGHCSSLHVKTGQKVQAGQLIGKVGATGVATGNHLHFEVRLNGKTQNPATFLSR